MDTQVMNSDPTLEYLADPIFVDDGEPGAIDTEAVGGSAWLLTSAGVLAAAKPQPRSLVDVRVVEFILTIVGVSLFVIVVAGAIGSALSVLLAHVVHALGG
jgi:hypothetical protein